MEHVQMETIDRIAVVTLDRPPVNALAYQTFDELAQAMELLSAGRDASVVVLRAAPGARVFCGSANARAWSRLGLNISAAAPSRPSRPRSRASP